MSAVSHHQFKNFYTIDHPLVQHKLSILRDKSSSKKVFKELINEITLLLAYEATKNLQVQKIMVETPLQEAEAYNLIGKKPVILPILRAGIGMVDALLSLMPSARVGHIGIFRDEKTLKPTCYFFKIPRDSEDRHFFICDPMLATGGSAVAAINYLKEKGIHRIQYLCIVAAPEGVKYLLSNHPEIPIYAAALDQGLNDKGYILPGLGDAGDRLFGTQ